MVQRKGKRSCLNATIFWSVNAADCNEVMIRAVTNYNF